MPVPAPPSAPQTRNIRWVLAIFLVLLWSAIAGAIVWIERLYEENARQDATRMARALSMQTSQFLQSVETALIILSQRLAATDLAPATVARILDEMRPSLPTHLDFGVFDAAGRGVAATLDNFPVGRSFADRDYFRAHLGRDDSGLHVAEPIVGRTAKAPLLPVSLRLSGPAGEFRGVLLATVYTRHLADIFAQFPLGERGLIVLVRTDPLQIVARTPEHDAYFARRVGSAPLFAGIARGEPEGQVEADAVDGESRLASWRQVDKYPLVLVAGIARSDIANALKTEHLALGGGGALVSLLAMLLAASLARERWRSFEVVATQAADARAIAELADSLKRAQAVASIGSWHLDIARGDLRWSDETYRIFAIPAGTLVDYDIFLSRIHPDDRAAVDAAWQAALKGESYDITHRICVDGALKWVREQADLVFDESGRPTGGTGTAQDVTRQVLDQIAHEQSRTAAEAANRAKSEFLAIMSHEIRTPLNAILGLTQLVLDGPLTEEQASLLRMSLDSGRTLLGILNDILDYSKIEAGRLDIERTPFSVEEVLRKVRDLFSAQIADKPVELALDVAPGLPPLIVGDPLRLNQVLVNLVGNAIKFTERGEVRIRVETAPGPANRPGSLALRFAVRDTGIGIDRQIAGRLFQPFTQADGSITRKDGGTGLGLAICKRLVDAMGGEIGVAGEPGAGSTFSFTIVVGSVAGDAAPAGRRNPDGYAPTFVKPHVSKANVMPEQKSAPAGRRSAGTAPLDEVALDDAALAGLLADLIPYLEERELLPDALGAALRAAARRAGEALPIAPLLRQIDEFDYDGALASIAGIAAQRGLELTPHRRPWATHSR